MTTGLPRATLPRGAVTPALGGPVVLGSHNSWARGGLGPWCRGCNGRGLPPSPVSLGTRKDATRGARTP